MSTNWFQLATDILYGGVAAMQTYEDALQSRSGCDDEPVPCANCPHMDFDHDPQNLCCRECTCRRFEPAEIGSTFELEDEGILD